MESNMIHNTWKHTFLNIYWRVTQQKLHTISSCYFTEAASNWYAYKPLPGTLVTLLQTACSYFINNLNEQNFAEYTQLNKKKKRQLHQVKGDWSWTSRHNRRTRSSGRCRHTRRRRSSWAPGLSSHPSASATSTPSAPSPASQSQHRFPLASRATSSAAAYCHFAPLSDRRLRRTGSCGSRRIASVWMCGWWNGGDCFVPREEEGWMKRRPWEESEDGRIFWVIIFFEGRIFLCN